MAMPVLVVFVVASLLADASSTLSLVQLRAKRTSAPATCVVWHSQHKSGGSTIEDMFALHPMKASGLEGPVSTDWSKMSECRFVCDRPSWNCDQSKCIEDWEVTEKAQSSCPVRVAMRGYTPTLAGSYPWGSPRDGTCLWATMCREPISRLISAYFYCSKAVPTDPLCGHTRLDPQKATIHEFAEHWGNYLFRELLWYPELYEMASKRPEFDPDAGYCVYSPLSDSMWLNLKDKLQGGDDLETESGTLNFEAVKSKLANGELYDVIGITERWNETMDLFNRKLELSDTDWLEVTLNHDGTHGSAAWKEEEEAALEKARKDPVILKALAADIRLYTEVLLPMFENQRALFAVTPFNFNPVLEA